MDHKFDEYHLLTSIFGNLLSNAIISLLVLLIPILICELQTTSIQKYRNVPAEEN